MALKVMLAAALVAIVVSAPFAVAQPSLAAAASGNAQASAGSGGQSITATGTPSGCGQAVTSGPNSFASASTNAPNTINIAWGLTSAGTSPVSSTPINACPGTTITFTWPQAAGDTNAYGLLQVPAAQCPTSTATPSNGKLIASPRTSGSASIRLSASGTYYFVDPNPAYCNKGLLLTVSV